VHAAIKTKTDTGSGCRRQLVNLERSLVGETVCSKLAIRARFMVSAIQQNTFLLISTATVASVVL